MNAQRRAAELDLLQKRLREVREEAWSAGAETAAYALGVAENHIYAASKHLREFAQTGPDCTIDKTEQATK